MVSWKNIFVDGTHTTQLGADLYAERIFHFIKTLAANKRGEGDFKSLTTIW